MSTKASDYFESLEDLQTLVRDACRLAKGERNEEFAAKMGNAVLTYGLNTYLSERQLKWLCDLGDWEMPARRPL